MNILEFRRKKIEGQRISIVTCYDFSMAQVLNKTNIDALLVGDSLATVMHGFPSTVHATLTMMELHTAAVARGSPDKFLIADMPFLSFRKGVTPTLDAVEILMRAGAHAVKLEGVDGHEDAISAIVHSGIPVMGHIGLTPQSLFALGGMRVQGKEKRAAEDLRRQAKRLEELGCFSIVLECIPTTVAAAITKDLSIPTIGIGAGPKTDGQVLVINDLLAMNPAFKPKFLRHYANGSEMIYAAVNHFHDDVLQGRFPTDEESYA